MTTCLPTLCAAGPTDPTRAEAKGGFTWWYADLVDARGDGLVVIVALGLPFLPGYASAAREGRAPAAVERPSVCVAHVQGGRLAFWALHETDPARVVWEPTRALLGDNALRVGVDGGASLRAALGGELPGARWSLALEVDGPLRRSSPGEP
ncbi:MAG: hypothetical protein KC621_19125, partial [Myxococcales bacterium]|nr:hypothetical protein [Myxococcales bacterium]